MASKAFSAADLDTGLIERCRAELFPADAGASDEDLAAAALAELLAEQAQAAAAATDFGDPHSPWNIVDGWRLNLGSHHELVFAEGERSHRVADPFHACRLDVFQSTDATTPSPAAKRTACCR